MSTKDFLEKDYYKALGDSKTAKPAEIKTAYRKLARKYHPDSNQGDAKAELSERAPDVHMDAVAGQGLGRHAMHPPEVDEPERAHASGGEILRGRAAEPARADQQHARVEQLALTLEADLGQDQVAAVAVVLLGRERRSGRIRSHLRHRSTTESAS